MILKKTLKNIAQEHQARHFATISLKYHYDVAPYLSHSYLLLFFVLFYQDDKFSGCHIRCLILGGISFLKIILKYVLLKS